MYPFIMIRQIRRQEFFNLEIDNTNKKIGTETMKNIEVLCAEEAQTYK